MKYVVQYGNHSISGSPDFAMISKNGDTINEDGEAFIGKYIDGWFCKRNRHSMTEILTI